MIRRADLDLEVCVELGFKVLGFSRFLFLVFMLKSYGLEGPFVFLFSFFFGFSWVWCDVQAKFS